MKCFIHVVVGLALSALLVALVGCNTTKGFGKDIESAGAGIEDTADAHGAD